jgi:hypothetical protein
MMVYWLNDIREISDIADKYNYEIGAPFDDDYKVRDSRLVVVI